jgi:hypothetical protein
VGEIDIGGVTLFDPDYLLEVAAIAGRPVKCALCGRAGPCGTLNVEAVIHHGARGVECIDRKACNRRRRKAKRRE